MERLHRLSGGDYAVSSGLTLFAQSADRNNVELVAPHLTEIEAIVARYRAALPQGSEFATPPPATPSAPLVSGPGARRPRSLVNGSLRRPPSLAGQVPPEHEDTYSDDDVGDWPAVGALSESAEPEGDDPEIRR
jgi:hypothetical protein